MIKLCTIVDYDGNACDRKYYARDMCRYHYIKNLSGGDIREPRIKYRKRDMTNAELIQHIIDQCEPAHNCLIWQGDRYYGNDRQNPIPKIKYQGESVVATRLLYRLTYGELSEGDLVIHRCGHTLCCAINHLFIGTHEFQRVEEVLVFRRQLCACEDVWTA